MQEKLDFLGSLQIFADLKRDELLELARIAVPYEFERGAIIAHKGDPTEQFYIVWSGRIEAFEIDERNVATRVGVYGSGDCFHDIWLFAPGIHETTLRAATDGVLLTIGEEDFFYFMEEHPNAIIDISEEASDELDHSRMQALTEHRVERIALQPGELIEYESRRTQLLLLVEMLPPMLFALIVPTVVIYMMGNSTVGNRGWLQVLAFVVLGIPPLLLATYRFIDWYNDYLWLTTKHIVHREFDLRTFSTQTIKLPLDNVQSVSVIKPTLLETLLRVGTVEVKTAAQNKGLKFDKISQPQGVEEIYNEIRQRERSLVEGRTRAAARSVLRRQFAVPDGMTAIDEGTVETKRREIKRSGKRIRRRGARFEIGHTIVYGKHWVVLFLRTWWVVLIMMVTVALAAVSWVNFPSVQIPFTLVAVAFVLFLELAFFYYLYEDWANDVFQLTDDLVIDIDRGPFGLTENRKAAQVANVQDVRAIRPNIIAAIFNYGNVAIDTAGTSAEIVFEHVANPTQVQTEIFERREQLLRRSRERDAVARRKEIGIMLEEYRRMRDDDYIPREPMPDISDDE